MIRSKSISARRRSSTTTMYVKVSKIRKKDKAMTIFYYLFAELNFHIRGEDLL